MRGGPTYAARLYASLCSNGHPAIQLKYMYSTLLLALLFGCVVYATATGSLKALQNRAQNSSLLTTKSLRGSLGRGSFR